MASRFFAGELDVVVNVAVSYARPDSPDSFVRRTTQVATWDVSEGGLEDRSFTIWFEV